MKQAFFQESALLLVIALFSVATCTEDCFSTDNPNAGQGLLNDEKTECTEIFKDVPCYLVYPENGVASNSSPIALAFVADQSSGFRLTRDRDLEESCPSFFNLESETINSWLTSSNPEDVVNALNDICFNKYIFVQQLGATFSFRLVYKIATETREDGVEIYKPRKIALSTPGGSDYVFVDQREDLARICTTCSGKETTTSEGTQDLIESAVLGDVLSSLK